MRYMMIVKHAENQGPVPTALMEAIGKHYAAYLEGARTAALFSKNHVQGESVRGRTPY